MKNGKDVIRETDRAEIWRYLGYHGQQPDAAIEENIDFCLEQLCREAEPRAVFRRCTLVRKEDGTLCINALPEDLMQGTLMETESRSLSKNLRDCSGVYLMAATLGPGPDRLVRRAQILSAGQMVIYQAAGAAMIEKWCDEVNETIRKEAESRGLFLRPRFSPGYADLPLKLQKDFLAALQMPKRIGVTLTDSLLMLPTKSVTAVIGLSGRKMECEPGDCRTCKMHEYCEYRRS